MPVAVDVEESLAEKFASLFPHCLGCHCLVQRY